MVHLFFDPEEQLAELFETLVQRKLDTTPGTRTRKDVADGTDLRVDFVYDEALAATAAITGKTRVAAAVSSAPRVMLFQAKAIKAATAAAPARAQTIRTARFTRPRIGVARLFHTMSSDRASDQRLPDPKNSAPRFGKPVEPPTQPFVMLRSRGRALHFPGHTRYPG